MDEEFDTMAAAKDAQKSTQSTGSSMNPLSDNASNNQPSSTSANPLSSEGAIGSKFNPGGPIGSIGQKVGGPLDKEGAIGSQFDAAKGGLAGKVESMLGGPRQGTGGGVADAAGGFIGKNK